MGAVSLHGAQRGDTLTPIPAPQRFSLTAPGPPAGEAYNVGQMYALFAQAIRNRATGGDPQPPSFETAVELHRLVDAVKEASDTGREGRGRVTAFLGSGRESAALARRLSSA